MTQRSITVTWDDSTGAEPNIFTDFKGKVFEATVRPPFNSFAHTIQFVWEGITPTDQYGHVIQGLLHDPDTGREGDPLDIVLSAVETLRYL